MRRETKPETSESTHEATPRLRGRHRGRRRDLGIVLAILVLPFGLVGLHVKAYRTFSPIDERQHVDYLYRISRGELLRMGDRIGQQTLRDEACRGLDWNFFTPPPCHPTNRINPDIYPDLAYNSAHVHPPAYYFMANLVGRTFRATGISEDFVSSARLSGGVWLSLALLLFWYSCRELRVSPKNGIIAVVLLATTPAIIHASSIVNPDSTSLLAGGALLLSVLVWERKRGQVILLLPFIAATAVALKFTNILAVAASVLYLLFRLGKRKRAGEDLSAIRGYIPAVSALTVAGIGTAILWMVVQQELIRISVNPQLEQFQVDSLSANAIIDQMMALVTPVREAWLPPFFNNAGVKGVLLILNLGLLTAVFGAPLFERHMRPRVLIAMSGGLIILASGAALTLANFYLNSRAYVAIPPRYGISVLPFLFVALTSALRRPIASWLAALLAVLSVFTILSGLLSAL